MNTARLSLDRVETVSSIGALAARGVSKDLVRSRVRGGRWQRIGRAVVLHNASPTAAELMQVALVVLGPRAALTSFTALAEWGLSGWSRDNIHVLLPRGATVCRLPQLPVRVHYTDRWRDGDIVAGRGLHRPAPSALLAAASFRSPRAACAVLAAVVQQRLARAEEVTASVAGESRIRHRALLLAASRDIEQGAQALSEIDFAVLCRRARLPEPTRQAVRVEASGRRRYLDVEWRRAGRRALVAEVDGALHMAAARWWKDQLRQNELVIGGDNVLRFPSVVVRCEPGVVIDQLRRALAVA